MKRETVHVVTKVEVNELVKCNILYYIVSLEYNFTQKLRKVVDI